jgi:hypothetical protein
MGLLANSLRYTSKKLTRLQALPWLKFAQQNEIKLTKRKGESAQFAFSFSAPSI